MGANGKERGVLYIAFGEKWAREAAKSIDSLRKHEKELDIAVIMDKNYQFFSSDIITIIKDRHLGFMSKVINLRSTPFKATLFVDTDTHFCESPKRLFDLLNYYNIGVMFGGPNLREDDLFFHTQCNSGVVLFDDSAATNMALENWEMLYREASGNLGLPHGKLGDQRYLAIAIAQSQARPVHLSSSVHCVVFGDTIFESPPLILHGKDRDLAKIAAQIRRGWDQDSDWWGRIWLRNMSGVMPRGVRRSDPLLATAVILRRIYNKARRALMSPQ